MGWTSFGEFPEYANFRAAQRVAKWPPDATPRTHCSFRMALGEGLPFPRPQRFLCFMDTVPDEPLDKAYPFIDMESSGEFELEGEAGANEFGRNVHLKIKEHPEPTFPGIEIPGIEYFFRFTMPTFDDFTVTYFFKNEDHQQIPRDVPMMADAFDDSNQAVIFWDDTMALSIDWPAGGFENNFNWKPMSRCFTFPEELPPLGMAEFNGIDSYISLLNTLAGFAQPFKLDAEIRLHDVTTFWPILGRDLSGGFFGMDGADIIFGTLRKPTSWVPVLDQWFTWEYEFEPLTQLQHKLTINDVVVNDSTNSRQFSTFNNLGVFRHGVPATIWGNFDMRNLLYRKGTPGNYTTVLNMPLNTDACDIGPNLNHGTTFNMTLPSC